MPKRPKKTGKPSPVLPNHQLVVLADCRDLNLSIYVRLRKFAFVIIYDDRRVRPVGDMTLDVTDDGTDIDLLQQDISLAVSLPLQFRK